MDRRARTAAARIEDRSERRHAVLAVEDEPFDVVGAGTASIVGSGSLTSTTPPDRFQYFVPAASIDITRAVLARRTVDCLGDAKETWPGCPPTLVANAATECGDRREGDRRAGEDALGRSGCQAGRRAATHRTAATIPPPPGCRKGQGRSPSGMNVPPRTCTA